MQSKSYFDVTMKNIWNKNKEKYNFLSPAGLSGEYWIIHEALG